jgi:EAL domain-containing protein (putative c-di-GMP-specific phosphodiesterase class I)
MMKAPRGSSLTMAFHPIVDVELARVWGYEALVRGTGGESAGWLLERVTDDNRHKFDQACRVRAIELASQIFPVDDHTRLSINFLPSAVEEPKACAKLSLEAALRFGFAPHRVMFEFNENKRLADTSHVQRIVEEYKRAGFLTAIDNFGAGFAGLGLIAKVQPDLIKIDMDLIRSIAGTPAKQIIVAGLVSIATQLGITAVAEGVETESEVRVLRAAGIRLFQGYYFSKPEIERLPPVRGIAVTQQERRTA